MKPIATSVTYVAAAVLHPAYKLSWIPTEVMKGQYKNDVVSLIRTIDLAEAVDNSGVSTVAARTGPNTSESNLVDLFAEYDESLSPLPSTNEVSIEDSLDQYLKCRDEVSLLPVRSVKVYNLPEYWERHREEFPTEYKLAQMLMLIPATNCLAERMLSVSGLLQKKISGQMKDSTLRDRTFLMLNRPLLPDPKAKIVIPKVTESQ